MSTDLISVQAHYTTHPGPWETPSQPHKIIWIRLDSIITIIVVIKGSRHTRDSFKKIPSLRSTYFWCSVCNRDSLSFNLAISALSALFLASSSVCASVECVLAFFSTSKEATTVSSSFSTPSFSLTTDLYLSCSS